VRCPSCHEENGYDDDEICDSCYADIEQQHEEYRQYLASLPPLQKTVRKVKGIVTRAKNAGYRWKRGTASE